MANRVGKTLTSLQLSGCTLLEVSAPRGPCVNIDLLVIELRSDESYGNRALPHAYLSQLLLIPILPTPVTHLPSRLQRAFPLGHSEL